MTDYQLQKGLYLSPTPYGAYTATATAIDSPEKTFLTNILCKWRTPELTSEELMDLTAINDLEKAQTLLFQCQEAKLIQGLNSQSMFPDQSLEKSLPEYLQNLATSKHAMLADNHGFYLANVGFEHDVAEEFAALSADIAIMHEKHERALNQLTNEKSNAWAIVDGMGNSRIGFWPMYIGEHRFVLVLEGNAQLNQPALTQLIQALCLKYNT